MPQKNCVLCSKKLKIHQRRPVNKLIARYLRKKFLIDNHSNHFICGKCSRCAYRDSESNYVEDSVKADQCKSPPSVRLNVKSAPKSHAYCFVCKKPGPKIITVPVQLRLSAFLNEGILISADSRCCPSHINDANGQSQFKEHVLSELKTKDFTLLNRTAIVELLNRLKDQATQSSHLTFNDFDKYKDEDVVNLTGLNKEQFKDLHGVINGKLKNTPVRSTQTTLGIFLFKLKCGLSNRLLSTLFGISKSSVRRAINSCRQILLEDIVPIHLGFQHITREEVIENHTRQLAQHLLAENDQQAILVLDGTYIYINKSSNFQFQRRSYSMHKGRPLVKPMVIVTTSGYFVSVLGPYLAKNNDALILKHIVQHNVDEIKNWVQENDIFVVDRGFRDAVPFLEDMGIKAEMPVFMKRQQKQMSTEDANASRLVTKVRWVVEAANGRIKQWRYLNYVLPTNQVPHIGDYVKIVCALCNRYLPMINPSSEWDRMIAGQMLDRVSETNNLQLYVESNDLHRRSVSEWTNASALQSDFPILDENTLRSLTLGTYQLKLCPSYIQEYLGGECEIQLYKEKKGLLRVRLQSRHISSKTYLVWIEYDSDHVKGWYCRCKAGARTVGTCSHVAAVLWYLGNEVPSGKNTHGVQDWGSHLDDAAQLPAHIDSSDSEESVVEE